MGMGEQDTRYAKSGEVHLAYQVTGDGPVDVVMIPGFISHVELRWREPALAGFLRQLGTFTRLIAFDKRGMGLSDRDPNERTPTLAQRVGDVSAVMDAAGCPRAALFAWSEGGATAIRFAVTHPSRVAALILVGTTPRFCLEPDFPEGIPLELLTLAVQTWQRDWGTGVALALYGPSVVDDARFGCRPEPSRATSGMSWPSWTWPTVPRLLPRSLAGFLHPEVPQPPGSAAI